ncbi:MFS transporter [Paenarthrobacter sp. MSM-2-10-13]|uniref:MFS transporter n=1 Tax=Micrococcaceae TaxID=1268 RepID=UPI00141DE486|nr:MULTISPECIES: MFS transporter [Micrococcaceae]MCM0617907.1 MFS transporter [Paenarthrobacter sp. TYUT067]NHW46712.1 MFS transporter [Paenarthrobacter sp. MSM-2-10-13]BCW61530.1 hypothetical protein StoSoilB22_05030 [Arthrobacter sp. StoSoilB22]
MVETTSTDATDEQQAQQNHSLARTGFYRLWVGDFVSNAGSAMMAFAVPVIGVTVLGLDATQVSWVVAAGLSAPLFISLSAGVIADRSRRHVLLHVCNSGRFIVFAVVLALMLAGSLNWQILAIALFSVGVLTLLYESAMAAAIPSVVPRKLLIRANSWIEGGMSVTESGGAAVAGIIISTLGAPFIVAINAVTYVFSSLMLIKLPLDRSSREAEDHDVAQQNAVRGHLREIRLGFSLLWKQTPQRVVLLAATAYNFFDSWILAVFSVYALTVLGMNPALLGLVFVIPAVVGIIGSALTDRITQRARLGQVLTVSFSIIALAGLCLPLTAATHGVSAAVITSIVFAVFELCIVVNMIIGRSMRQALFPERHLSKVAGTARFVSWGVDPIGALMGGAVAAIAGVQASVVVGSCGFVVGALICLCSRQLRSFTRLPVHDGLDEPPSGPVQPAKA